MSYSSKALAKLIDTRVIVQMNICEVTSLVSTVVHSPEFDKVNDFTSDIKNIVMHSTDRVTINLHNKEGKAALIIAKSLYSGILEEWIVNNKRNTTLGNIDNLIAAKRIIASQPKIERVQICARRLANIIHVYNTCDGKCTTVTPEKEIGGCHFGLNDQNALNKFTAGGIADTMCAIVYAVMELNNSKHFIDMGTSMITCDGSVTRTVTPKVVSCNTAEMQKIYRIYITNWCLANSKNINHTKLLRDSIHRVYKFTKLEDIFSYTHALVIQLDYNCATMIELEKHAYTV